MKLVPTTLSSPGLQPLPANSQPNVSGNIQYHASPDQVKNVTGSGNNNGTSQSGTTGSISESGGPLGETTTGHTNVVLYVIGLLIIVALLAAIWKATRDKNKD